MPGLPIGISLFVPLGYRTLLFYKSLVILLTYITYASYHLSRRPFSVVKSVFTSTNCTNIGDCNWAPFDQDDAQTLFSILDSVFLFAYAFSMFVCGFVAERSDIRYFLAIGMLFSGLFCYALGLARYYNIHSLTYFIIFQFLSGSYC